MLNINLYFFPNYKQSFLINTLKNHLNRIEFKFKNSEKNLRLLAISVIIPLYNKIYKHKIKLLVNNSKKSHFF